MNLDFTVTKKRTLQFLAIAGIAVYLASCSFYSTEWPSVKDEKDRKKAPEFVLKDASGQDVKLSDYHGKVVLLNFWATWCGPCEVEIPWFIDFQREYKDRDFAVLGVSLDEDGWKSVRPFVANEKVNYRVMVTTEQVDQLYGGVDSLPTTFIIDREGRVASSHVGLASKNTYRKEILTLLNDSHKTERGAVSSIKGPLAFATFGAAWVGPAVSPVASK
ncbi:MAG TPA: TlpA disulfide reductase family protein [Bryobacteraceae bacterium]